MDENARSARIWWSLAAALPAAATAGYYAFSASLPDCGPPRNTTLGQIYWFVPLTLLLLQSSSLAIAGFRTQRGIMQVAAVIALALLVTLFADAGILIYFFSVGNCGE